MTLFVGHLNERIKEKNLQELFQEHGSILSIDRKGTYAFIVSKAPPSAPPILSALSPHSTPLHSTPHTHAAISGGWPLCALVLTSKLAGIVHCACLRVGWLAPFLPCFRHGLLAGKTNGVR
ncbi:hypothetical protein GQ54DRAFT_70637 [Martensiomyces pterosporus]|nr:hypothetical protein GQ54DRAFT_70637 [Martensiomyces pterosporus]